MGVVEVGAGVVGGGSLNVMAPQFVLGGPESMRASNADVSTRVGTMGKGVTGALFLE